MDNKQINEKELENVNGGFIPPYPPTGSGGAIYFTGTYKSPQIEDTHNADGNNIPKIPLVHDKKIRND